MIQYIRSMLFIVQMYVAMLVYAIIYTPFAVFSDVWVFRAIHGYCWWVQWTAGWMVGLKTEVRGTPPEGEVLIAAKHQSFLDIIMIAGAVPRPKFIMKSSLRWTPILGWYSGRMGCVRVNRGKRAEAIRQMMEGVANGQSAPGQLIIYPQGTRVAPGRKLAYKIGSALLYEQLGEECYPVATNVGVFWPRRGLLRKPGLAVVEFLDPIAPGLEKEEFLTILEEVVESNSNRLMAEAGFNAEDRDT